MAYSAIASSMNPPTINGERLNPPEVPIRNMCPSENKRGKGNRFVYLPTGAPHSGQKFNIGSCGVRQRWHTGVQLPSARSAAICSPQGSGSRGPLRSHMTKRTKKKHPRAIIARYPTNCSGSFAWTAKIISTSRSFLVVSKLRRIEPNDKFNFTCDNQHCRTHPTYAKLS